MLQKRPGSSGVLSWLSHHLRCPDSCRTEDPDPAGAPVSALGPGTARPSSIPVKWHGPQAACLLHFFFSRKAAAAAKSLQSCATLCDPMDGSPPGSSIPGILQARILDCVALPSSRDLPNPEIEPASLMSPALAGGLFTTSTTREAHY